MTNWKPDQKEARKPGELLHFWLGHFWISGGAVHRKGNGGRKSA